MKYGVYEWRGEWLIFEQTTRGEGVEDLEANAIAKCCEEHIAMKLVQLLEIDWAVKQVINNWPIEEWPPLAVLPECTAPKNEGL